MFSSPHQIRFFLFVVLLFQGTSTPLKDIIERVSKEKEISTIAFFGHSLQLESVLLEADVDIPRVVYTESYGDIYFSGNFNKNILVVACINLWQRAMLNRIETAFRGIHSASRSIYLIHDDRYKNLRYLYGHFEWCWAKGFVNVLVTFTSTNETFFYNRFPEMRVYRGSLDDQLFPNKFDNLMGYSIRTPLQYDPPRVFEYVDSKGRLHVTGYCADLFLAFLRRHNATLEIIRVKNSTDYDLPAIVKLIREGLVDISIHTYMDFDGVRSSYPVRMMQWCILVPFRGEIRAYWYFIRPFQPYLWLSCLGTLICISFVVAIEEYRAGMNFDFGRYCCDVFRLLMWLPITDCRTFGFRRGFRKLLICMLGFMLTNLYLAYLTSFLAKIIFDPQIETLEELVSNNISILTRDFEIPLILRNRGLPPGFDRLLVPTSAVDLMHHRWSLKNQSFAYSLTDDKALFVLRQQVHLKQPLYRVVEESVSTIPIGFLMARHSPFEGILNRFILRANAGGLLFKYWADMYSNGMKAGILKILPSGGQQGPPLSMEHFQFAWIALGGGLGVAMICAVLEKVAGRLRRFKVVVVHR